MPTRLHKPTTRRTTGRAPKLTTLVALLLPAFGSHAVTYTWQGGQVSTVWGQPLNWANLAVPVSAADTVIRFPTLAGLSQNNLGNNFRVNQIRAYEFAGGGGVVTGQSLSMAGPNAEILVGTGGSLNLATPLTGSTAWRKTGSGILSLTAANTGMSGDISVAAGRLNALSALALGSGAIMLSPGAVVGAEAEQSIAGLGGAGGVWQMAATTTLRGVGDHTFAGVVEGAGDLRKTGSGTQTFTGVLRHTGATLVEAGTLALAGGFAQSTGQAALSVRAGATASASGGATWDVAGTTTLGGGGLAEARWLVSGASIARMSSLAVSNISDATSRVRVQDFGSRLTVSGDLEIGQSGIGVVELSGSDGSAAATTLGRTAFGLGELNLDNAAFFDAGELTLGVAGEGRVSLRDAATLESRGAANLGFGSGSVGRALLADGSRWDHRGDSFVVGSGGEGFLELGGGSRLSTGTTTLGLLFGARGTASIVGAGTLWTVDGGLRIGQSAVGRLDVADAAEIRSTSGSIAANPTASAVVELRGGAAWTMTQALSLGSSGGSATLHVLGGSRVQAQSITASTSLGSSQILVQGQGGNGPATLSSAGALDIGEGVLSIGGGGRVDSANASVGVAGLGASVFVQGAASEPALWSVTGGLTLGSRANGTLTVRGHGTVQAGSMTLGGLRQGVLSIADSTGLRPTVRVTELLDIGGFGSGRVEVGQGGVLLSGAGRIGSEAPAASGTATLTADARWAVGGDLAVGSNLGLGTAPAGTLSIGGSAGVEAGRLFVGRNGVVNLGDSGVLSVGSIAPDSQGALRWSGGTLRITGTDGATLGTTPFLPQRLVLVGNQVLEVTNRLAIGRGIVFLASDQADVRAGDLALGGGQILGRPLTLAPDSFLSGWGAVPGQVVAGNAAVVADGGTLAVGDLNDAQGFTGASILSAQRDSRLIVQSAAPVQASAAFVDTGGTLQSINGLVLAEGGRLTAVGGNAAVVGRFTNSGQVEGSHQAGQWLSFNDAVDGAGGFSGNVRFQQGYDPGGNAAVQIGMGSLGLVGSSIIEMDIAAVPASAASLSGHAANDRLDLTGSALLDGTLVVDFATGYVPMAGQSFVLMTYAGHSGGFDHVALNGLDPLWRGELNYGANELRLTVAVVPEPGTWALLALGLAAIGVAARRRLPSSSV